MIKDCKTLRDFEKRMIRERNADLKKNLMIYEEMYKLYRKMRGGRKKGPLEGLETIIKVARVVNSV